MTTHAERAPGRSTLLHDDGLQSQGERLPGDEASLRHRPFDGIDQQQYAVDHRQHTLHLATEIGMTRSVDDVDVCIPVFDRAVLGDNRDAPLALEVIAVHHPLGDVLVRCEGAGLDKQLVDQRGLAVVDVGDDRDVAELAGGGHGAVRDESRLL